MTANDDGSAEIVIDCEGFEWITGWVLQFGTHAWITEPIEAREAMRERITSMEQRLAI